MVDDIPVSGGSGYTVATQERSSRQIQQVLDTGNASIAVGVASVTTTSASAVSARTDRRRVILLVARSTFYTEASAHALPPTATPAVPTAHFFPVFGISQRSSIP